MDGMGDIVGDILGDIGLSREMWLEISSVMSLEISSEISSVINDSADARPVWSTWHCTVDARAAADGEPGTVWKDPDDRGPGRALSDELLEWRPAVPCGD